MPNPTDAMNDFLDHWGDYTSEVYEKVSAMIERFKRAQSREEYVAAVRALDEGMNAIRLSKRDPRLRAIRIEVKEFRKDDPDAPADKRRGLKLPECLVQFRVKKHQFPIGFYDALNGLVKKYEKSKDAAEQVEKLKAIEQFLAGKKTSSKLIEVIKSEVKSLIAQGGATAS